MPKPKNGASLAAAESLPSRPGDKQVPDQPTVASIRQELLSYEMPTFGTDKEIAARFQILSEINQIQNAPEWLLARTPTTIYRLIADSGSALEQELELSYDEYESVKLHLAKMRGYAVEEEVA